MLFFFELTLYCFTFRIILKVSINKILKLRKNAKEEEEEEAEEELMKGKRKSRRKELN